VFSINVPVPGRVARIASDLHPALVDFDWIRDRHSLLVKRLGDPDHVASLQHEVRRVVADAPAFEAEITGLDYFADPPDGSAPVVYLAVESPGLCRLHRRLVDRFGAVDALEGDDYVPHVTLARDGSEADARRLAAREIEPVTWTVSKLQFWDGTYDESVSSVSLP